MNAKLNKILPNLYVLIDIMTICWKPVVAAGRFRCMNKKMALFYQNNRAYFIKKT